jgi:hypothetical protein
MKLSPIALAGALGFFATASFGVAQTPGIYWPVVWAHAYVSTVGDEVSITHVGSNGCYDEKIELNRFRTQTVEHLSSPATIPLAIAVNRLSGQGYELVGDGSAYCHTDNRRAIHFKKAWR